MAFNKETRALTGLCMGHFCVDLYSAILVPLYPFITAKLGITLSTISLVIALAHMFSSMMQPLFGFISDKLHHRVFMVWGLIVVSIFIPFTIKTNTVWLFSLLLVVGMMGNAFFHPQVSALIKSFKENSPDVTRSMGVFMGMGTIGYATGPYISTFLVETFSENALLLMLIPGIFTSIFMYFFVPKMPARESKLTDNFFFIIKEILKNKTCVYLTFVSVIKSAVSISFGTYIPFLLKDNGFNLTETGIIVTLFFIAGGTATMLSSKVEKYLSANGVVVLSFLSILPLTLAFLYLIKISKILAVAIFILIGFFILLSVGILIVYAQKAVPKYLGVVSGIIQGFSWGLGALFLAPLGIIGENYGVDKILLVMAVLAFLVGLYTAKNKCLKEIS